MSMQRIFRVLLLAGMAAGAAGAAEPPDRLDGLQVLKGGYPRAFFFRSSEGMANNQRVTYEQWNAAFSRLMGIEGKVLNEELPGLGPRNVEFFTRFKREHPDQLVMLHFNGNARDPRWQAEKFFAGHWLYCVGAKVTADVPAADGETDIRVDRPQLFRTNMGRFLNANEDIGLCLLDGGGRPDWNESEQVQLVSADAAAGTIRVRRGCYGTRPRAFPAGKAYAAAHATEGPWGKNSNLLWFYNYSTRCPKDKAGRTCADVLADDVARRFLAGGELAAFDGLEFDVLDHQRSGARGRSFDCDADGRPDDGVFDGLNTYGAGVTEFCRALRQKMGDRRFILADGMLATSQRAFGLLNGIESEGWPSLTDKDIRGWSSGLNRHFFWAACGRPPVFNYVNHKFTERSDQPGVVKQPEVPWSTHRLVFAAAVMTDAAVCYSFAPPKESGELVGVWDELWMGTARRPGWLGMPKGPPIRLAEKKPDLLAGKGAGKELLARLEGDGVRMELQGRGVRLSAAKEGQAELRVRLKGIPCSGPDLYVTLTVGGEPMRGYPKEVARLAWVGMAEQGAAASLDLAMKIRPPRPGEEAKALRQFMTWVGPDEFTATFYFQDAPAGPVDLEILIEGGEPVILTCATARAHPDTVAREFDGGLVLANPSPRPFTFDLQALWPGQSWRRLQGSALQDPKTNDGSPVAGKAALGPKDALFLVRAKP
jgi:hypothetical protein